MASEAKDSLNSGVESRIGAAETVACDSDELRRREQQSTQVELSGVLGRYKILRRLGAGGMGTVYLAHDAQFDHQVALKVPHFSDTDDQRRIERFYREARAAIKLRHSNLCPVYDVGAIDGQHYLAMAYIEGRPLSDLIDPRRPLSERRIAHLVGKIALALQEAHDSGIVHRDLKPGNIMFDEKRKEPIVMDFGLATQVGGSSDARLTQAGTLIGSPAYMSPEQVGSNRDAVGPASDIYSLGVILYELLTGRVPFEGPTAIVLGMIAIKEPEPPSRRRPEIDPRLEAICLKAMSKNIADRYASMREFAAALGAFAGSLPDSGEEWVFPAAQTVPVTNPALQPTAPFTPADAPPAGPGDAYHGRWRTLVRRAGPWIAGSVGGALAALAIALVVFKPPPAGPAHPAPGMPPGNGPPGLDRWAGGFERPPHPPHHERRELENFAIADRNGDGVLTPDEYPLHIILRADSNGDGSLSKNEFDAGRARLGDDRLFGPPTEEERRRLPHPDGPPPQGRPPASPGPGA
ncbi:MAG: protein kinase [Planctomycetia bacterium]|nr:protein kinase [Planctomycetia bacterium]